MRVCESKLPIYDPLSPKRLLCGHLDPSGAGASQEWEQLSARALEASWVGEVYGLKDLGFRG